MVDQPIQDITLQQFVNEVSDQHHAMSGAVIAASAMQTVALAEACVQISLDNQIDKLDWQAVSQRIQKIDRVKTKLVKWWEHERTVIAEYIGYVTDDGPATREPLLESSERVSTLLMEVLALMTEFRPSVYKEVQADFDVTVQLLISLAETTLTLYKGRLDRWADTPLKQKYTPQFHKLQQQFADLTT